MLFENYFQQREYFIRRVWFHHAGICYDGNGLLIWNPDRGFHLAAQLKNLQPLPSKVERRVEFVHHPVLVKMILGDGRRAFTSISDQSVPTLSTDISINFGRVIFIQLLRQPLPKPFWYGSAIYRTHSDLLLPDSVQQKITIEDVEHSTSSSLSGIEFRDADGQYIKTIIESKILNATWALPRSGWKKEQGWRFADALVSAISIEAGETVQLLCRQVTRKCLMYTEFLVNCDPKPLGLVFRFFDDDILNKDRIVRLSNLLVQSSKESDVCHHILQQVASAAQQPNVQAQELLLATVLEAALRTLYGQPFDPNHNARTDPFDLRACLKKFREQYLSADLETGRKWKKVHAKVFRVHKQLRDRNAHPDWLTSAHGALSDARIKESVNDMIFLSRFYGYMILALAGFRSLEPIFPKTYDQWAPIITITRDEPLEAQNA